MRVNFRNFHTVANKCDHDSQDKIKFFFPSNHSVEKREILSHWKKISSNQLFSNLFSKTNAFTKFLRKNCEREFLEFPHCEGVARSPRAKGSYFWYYPSAHMVIPLSYSLLYSNYLLKTIDINWWYWNLSFCKFVKNSSNHWLT